MDGSSPDLFGHLKGLLGGTVSLAQFRRWFADASWRIEAFGNDEDNELAARVENRLAEHSGGHVTDDCLLDTIRQDLAGRIGSVVVVHSRHRRGEGSATTNDQRMHLHGPERGRGVDRRPSLPVDWSAATSSRVTVLPRPSRPRAEGRSPTVFG